MRKWTKAAGVLAVASAAVFSGRWIAAGVSDNNKPTDISSGNAGSDPAAPQTRPSGDAAPSTQPAASHGQSVLASQVNVSDAGTVEIHVNDANLIEVLRMLSLQSQKNIVASKEVHGTVTANLYDVTIKEALDAILHANGYDYRQKGNFIYVYTVKELQDMDRAALARKTEVFRLYYTPAANAVNLLKPVLSNDAQVALTTPAKAGLATGSTASTGGDDHAGDDILVVTDYPENLEKVKKVIKEVDRRPQQVLVEATILRASLGENNALGVNFTVLSGVNFSKLGSVAGNTTSGSGGTGGTGGTGGSTGSTSGSSGPTGPSASNAVNSALSGAIIDNPMAGGVLRNGLASSQFGGSGLNVGVITSNVGVFLTALEGVTDTTVLANPKVLVLNKQQGEVHVGDNLGYKTSITTDTLTSTSVNFLDTGTRLVFRPFIGDNGYIRMEIHPEDSNGTIDQNGLPQKNTTEITSNIMVQDGRTVVIGGLFRDATTRTRSQVPFLGSIPGLGALFRQQTDATQREEIIILLTPHVIKDMDQYGAASDEEAKYAERMRVGMRRGLMPWGRERLAESWYEMAVKEMRQPHPNRQMALWHLNCAINLNPLFSEAMELRAQITGKEVTATDNSTIRSFVRRQIMSERGMSAEPAAPAVVPIDTPTTTQTNDKPTPPLPPQQALLMGSAPVTRPAATQATAAVSNDDAVEERPAPSDEKK